MLIGGLDFASSWAVLTAHIYLPLDFSVMRYRRKVVNNNQQRSFTGDYISKPPTTKVICDGKIARRRLLRLLLTHYGLWIISSFSFSLWTYRPPPMHGTLFGVLIFISNVCNLSTPCGDGQSAKITQAIFFCLLLLFRRHFDTRGQIHLELTSDILSIYTSMGVFFAGATREASKVSFYSCR